MAINTRGFQVNNMPQYTGPDPRLVAFNPSAIADGIGSTLNLAQMIEKIKADRALQQELSETRAKRIAAQNAKADVAIADSGKTVRQLPQLENLENMRMGAEASLIPGQTDLSRIKIAEDTKTIPVVADATRRSAALTSAEADANKTILPEVVAAKSASAKAAAADANIATQTADARGKNAALGEEVKSVQLALAKEVTKLDAAQAPAEAKLKLLQINDAIANAKTDAEMNRALKMAELALKSSMVNENNARAAAMGVGKTKTTDERVKELQSLIKSIQDSKVSDLKTNVGVYKENTFKDDGSQKTNWFMPDPERDAVGDMYLKMLEQYQAELASLSGGVGVPIATEAAAAPDVSPKYVNAIKWVQDKRNVNHPKYQENLQILRDKGLIK